MLITDNYELSWNGELGWCNNIKFSFDGMKNVFKERNYNKNWTLHKMGTRSKVSNYILSRMWNFKWEDSILLNWLLISIKMYGVWSDSEAYC